MFKPSTFILSAALFSLLLIAPGCSGESHRDREADRDRDRVSRRDRLDDRYDQDRIRDRDRRDVYTDDDRDLRNIPRNARRVDSARGTTEMEFESSRSGTIYVYDVDDDRVVCSGRLRDGDRFELDADDNVAMINGKKVLDADLKSRHVFRLYFDDRD